MSIQEFDLDSPSTNSNVLILGRRRSGKSWLIRDMMYHNNLDKLVFSDASTHFGGLSDAPDSFYVGMPQTSVYSKWNSNIVKTHLKVTRTRVQ